MVTEEGIAHSSAHAQLARMVGTWEGTVRTWFEPGKLGDEARVRGTMRAILDGRFIVHEYETTLMGNPSRGLALYGYDVDKDRFQMSWVDSSHMNLAMMFAEGDPGQPFFSVLGHYQVPGNPDWGWRTTIAMSDDGHLTITAYNVTPDGQEAKAVETEYTRRR